VLASLARALLLAGLAAVAAADSVGKVVFTIRERLATWAKEQCPAGTLAKDLSFSELRIFDGGDAEERTWNIAACGNPANARDWTPPSGSKLRKFRVTSAEYQRFRQFLDDPNVVRLTSFLNAGPGVGDYELAVYRVSGTQRIPVMALMPDHVDLRRDPTLLRLICGAKRIAGVPEPGWCPTSGPEHR